MKIRKGGLYKYKGNLVKVVHNYKNSKRIVFLDASTGRYKSARYHELEKAKFLEKIFGRIK